MAVKDRLIEIAYALRDRFSTETPKVKKSIGEVDKANKKAAASIEKSNKKAAGSYGLIGKAASKTKLAVLGIVAAAAGAVAAISKWTEAAAIQERAETKLAASLRALTGATNEEIDALKRQASALQEVTGYGDESTISAQAMLATFQLTAAQIGELTPRLLDMAEAARKAGKSEADLETIAIALGKAFTSGIGSLGRYGVAMSNAQKEAFKQATQAEKVRILTEVLDGNFKGLATTVGETYEGALRKADAAQGDFYETLGFLFTRNKAFVKFQQLVANSWVRLSEGITGSSKEIGLAITAVSRILIAGVNAIVVAWNTAQIIFKAGATVILTAIRAIVSGLEAITFGEVSAAFKLMKDDIDKYGGELLRGIEGDTEDIKKAMAGVGDAFTDAFEGGVDPKVLQAEKQKIDQAIGGAPVKVKVEVDDASLNAAKQKVAEGLAVTAVPRVNADVRAVPTPNDYYAGWSGDPARLIDTELDKRGN